VCVQAKHLRCHKGSFFMDLGHMIVHCTFSSSILSELRILSKAGREKERPTSHIYHDTNVDEIQMSRQQRLSVFDIIVSRCR
jgi:hypothetical protein